MIPLHIIEIKKKYLNVLLQIQYNHYINEIHNKDYMYILFKAYPKSEISKFINAYKNTSNRLLKKKFPQIKTKVIEKIFFEHK